MDHKDAALRSHRPVHAFAKLLNQRLLGPLNNSVCKHEAYDCHEVDATRYKLPVVNMCNLLNLIYVPTTILKFSNMTTNKIQLT